jgi:hypothetical protein
MVVKSIEMKNKNTLKLAITVLLISIFHFNSFAQTSKDTLKVLFVGNSYTYFHNLAQMVSLISDSAQTKIITRKSTIGGANLSEHWLGERGLKTKEIIKNGKFDIVVLQNHSLETINQPERFIKYMNLFCDYIKENNSKPFLYNTWAREKKPEMQLTIDKLYKQIAVNNNATIVPVGRSWEIVKEIDSTLKLYESDGSHPSEIGTFIIACTFVHTLLNEFPESLKTVYRTKDINNESITVMRCSEEDVQLAKELITKIY